MLRRALVAAPLIYLAHNLEEGVGMVRWTAHDLPAIMAELRDAAAQLPPGAAELVGQLQPPTSQQFWLAIVVVTVIPALICWLALVRGPASAWTRAAVWIQAIFCVNVFIPHLLGALWLRRYTPGVITAVGLNLPLSVVILRGALLERVVTRRALAIFGMSAVACVAAFGLLLLAISRMAVAIAGSV